MTGSLLFGWTVGCVSLIAWDLWRGNDPQLAIGQFVGGWGISIAWWLTQ